MPRLVLRSLALALCLLAATPASAAPLSQGGVLIADDGTVLLSGQRVGKLKLPPGKRRLRVERGRTGGRTLVLAHVIGNADRAATLAISRQRGATKVLFAGSTGPQGVDGEWSLHLTLRGGRLLRYQRRPGLSRCDGQPVRLFPQVYDAKSGRFRSVVLPPKASKLPLLTAKRTPASASPPLGLSTFRPVAASTQLGDQGRASELSAPLELTDGRADRPWVEGRSSDGRGEWVTLRRGPSPYKLRALRIVPGDAASRKAFAASNRLASVIVALSPKERFRVRFPQDPLRAGGDVATPYIVTLPRPSDSRCVTVLIERVYHAKGAPRRGGRTAIGELRAVTELEGAKGRAQLLADLRGDDDARARGAIGVLALQGEAALGLLAKPLATAKRGSVLLARLLTVLARVGTAKAAALAASTLPRLAPRGQRVLEELLRGLRARVQPTLERMLVGPHEPGALIATRLLARLHTASVRRALLARVGLGTRRLRAAVATALTAQRDPATTTEVLAALRAAAPERLARRADLVLVLGRLGRRPLPASARRASLATELTRRWPAGDTASTFELRYRLVRAVGRLDGGGQRAWLLARSRATDSVLRWQALLALAADKQPAVTQRLVGALRDKDPRVRGSAAEALATRPSPIVAKALHDALRYEAWPMVARAAASALGRHCSAATDKALRRAIAKRALGIDVAALSALARCRPADLFDTLLTYAMSRKQPVSLRRRAVALLDKKLVGSRARIIASLFLRLRRESMANAAAERVAAEFARTLGRVGQGKTAGRPLRDALSLAPSVAIRAAAARALGRVCWAPSLGALRRALADPAPAVRRGARDAIRACRSRR
jgi:HEAT repeat protein